MVVAATALLLSWASLSPGGLARVEVAMVDGQARPVEGERYLALVARQASPRQPTVERLLGEGESAAITVPAGSYFLICLAKGFLPAGLWAHSRIPVEARLDQPIRAICQLPPAGVAKLAAIADDTGKPLAGARFALAAAEHLGELASPLAREFVRQTLSCETGSEGHCELRGPLGQTADVVVSAPLYGRVLIPALSFSSPPAEGMAIRLAPAAKVEIAVTGVLPWAAGRAPGLVLLPAHLRHLRSVRERIVRWSVPVKANGAAIFENVSPGTYVLEVVPDSGEGWEELDAALGHTVEVVAGDHIHVDVPLVDVTVVGTVHRLPWPVERCEMRWQGPAGRDLVATRQHDASESARFVARLRRHGVWHPIISCQTEDGSWAYEGAPVEVTTGADHLDWDVRVGPDPFVGFVVDARGLPAEGARVSVTHQGECASSIPRETVSCEARTTAEGRFVCPGVGSGIQQAWVAVRGAGQGFGPEEVANGGTLALTRWRRLRVTIERRSPGEPASWRGSFSCRNPPHLTIAQASGDHDNAIELFAPRCAGALLLWRPQQEESLGLLEVPAGGDQTLAFSPEPAGVATLSAGQVARLLKACPQGTAYVEGPWGHLFRLGHLGAFRYPFAGGPKALPFLAPRRKWALVVAAPGCAPCARVPLSPPLVIDEKATIPLP